MSLLSHVGFRIGYSLDSISNFFLDFGADSGENHERESCKLMDLKLQVFLARVSLTFAFSSPFLSHNIPFVYIFPFPASNGIRIVPEHVAGLAPPLDWTSFLDPLQ